MSDAETDDVFGRLAVDPLAGEPDLAGNSHMTRIHLDEVDGLGTFVEFEVVLTDDETDSDGERIASDLMEQLGVRQEHLIERAYIDLLED